MQKHFLRLMAVLLLYPYLIGFYPDSTESEDGVYLLLGAGTGQITRRTYGCGGVSSENQVPFTDVGAGIEYRYNNIVLGAKGGGFASKSYTAVLKNDFGEIVGSEFHEGESLNYLNPYAGLKFKYFALTVGSFMIPKNLQKGDLQYDLSVINVATRIGSEEGVLVSGSFLNNMPLVSGGGMLDFGVGVCFERVTKTSGWIGFGLIDFENAGLVLKYSTRIANEYHITITGGYGGSGKTMLISGGLRYRLSL